MNAIEVVDTVGQASTVLIARLVLARAYRAVAFHVSRSRAWAEWEGIAFRAEIGLGKTEGIPKARGKGNVICSISERNDHVGGVGGSMEPNG